MKEWDNIEELFSSTMGEERVVPPSNVKENIDKELFGTRKKGFKFLLGAVLVLLLGTTAFFYSQQRNNKEIIADDNNSISQVESGNNKFNESKTIVGINSALNKKLKNQPLEKTDLDPSVEGKAEVYSTAGVKTTGNENNSKTVGESNTEGSKSIYNNEKREEPLVEDFVVENTIDHVSNNGLEGEAFYNQELTPLKPGKVFGISRQFNNDLVSSNPNLGKIGKNSLLTFSLYGGTGFSRNTIKSGTNDFGIKESSLKSISAEVSGYLKGNFGWASGIEFAHRKESFNQITQTTDSNLVNSYWDVVYNPNDSTWDSTWVMIYNVDTVSINSSALISTTVYSLPIFLQYRKSIGRHLEFVLSSGVTLSYINSKILSNPNGLEEPKQKAFGMSIVARPELRYNYRQYGFGVYSSLASNIITGTQWHSFSRNRFRFGLGLSLSVSF